MAIDFQKMYQEKLMTPDEAVKMVKDGDWVDYHQTGSFPQILDEALGKRSGELKDVKVRSAISMMPIHVVEDPHADESFTWNVWHCSGLDRKYVDEGRAYYIPMLFRYNGSYYTKGQCPVDVLFLSVTTMDKNGDFSYGHANCCIQEEVDIAKKIILEVNPNMPRVYGIYNDHINITEVDAVVECDRPVPTVPSPKASELDKKIAENIFPYFSDGMTLQLGIGGLPNALGTMIAESDLKDLGMHTELMSTGYLDLYNAGKITNKKKTLFPGKGIFSICNGSKELYEFLDYNNAILTAPMAWVNDPHTLGQLDNFVSVNGCIAMDLFGQISSESAGLRHISGTGGQLDFVTGAWEAARGVSILAMPSAKMNKKTGKLRSNIIPYFTGGDIITTPRTSTGYVVTEQGVAFITGLSTWERAEQIINIAHPDFRDELVEAAEAQGIWRKSNKK